MWSRGSRAERRIDKAVQGANPVGYSTGRAAAGGGGSDAAESAGDAAAVRGAGWNCGSGRRRISPS